MELRVLGPVEIRQDGQARSLSGRLQRVLFGVLLARANQPVPVDALIDALWGDRPDPRAGQKLQLHVHRLRSVLGADRLSFDPAGYRLRVLPDELDVERFESLVDEALEIADQCQDKSDKHIESNAVTGLAKACLRSRRDDEALEYARQGLRITQAAGYRSLEADNLRIMGIAFLRFGDHDQALRHLEAALAIARAVGDTGFVAEILSQLGAAHASAGRPADALRCLGEALAVATKDDHREVLAQARADIADVYAGLGDHASAREHRRAALGYYEELGLPDGEARLRQRLSHLGDSAR